jgi:cephalosporin hydroxylase
MLHPDVLSLLYHFALFAKDHMLELGAYVGGATAAISWGIQASKAKKKLVSVELGGRWDHPTSGSEDIVRDLRRNIDAWKIGNYVNLVVGNSRDAKVVDKVHKAFDTERVSVLLIDSDGDVLADMARYRDLLSLGAYLIIDDYFSPGAPDKVQPTHAGIEALESADAIETFGVFGWGTWVGRLRS